MAADGPKIIQELETTTAHRLTRTPDGWRAFSSIFMAKLGGPLRATLKAGMAPLFLQGLDVMLNLVMAICGSEAEIKL